MKIIINIKELASYKKSFENISKLTGEDTVKSIADLKASIDNNPLVNYKLTLNGLEIKINPDYMIEYMDLYGKYINIVIPQAKSLYATMKMFAEDSNNLILRYQKPETNIEDNKGEE